MSMAISQATLTKEATYYIASKEHTLSGNGAQANNVFAYTGIVLIKRLYTIITAVTNSTTCTSVYYNLYDGTNNVVMSVNTGSNISGYGVGSLIIRRSTAAAVVGVSSATQVRIWDPAQSGVGALCECVALAKNGTTSYVQIAYTGDANTNITVKTYCEWRPLSDDGGLTSV